MPAEQNGGTPSKIPMHISHQFAGWLLAVSLVVVAGCGGSGTNAVSQGSSDPARALGSDVVTETPSSAREALSSLNQSQQPTTIDACMERLMNRAAAASVDMQGCSQLLLPEPPSEEALVGEVEQAGDANTPPDASV